MINNLLRLCPLRRLVQLAPLVVFGILVWFSDWQRLAGLLNAPRAGLLAGAAVAALSSTAAQAAAWRLLLAAQGWNSSPARCWISHLIGLFLGRLTPNHIGEWAKVAYVLEGPAGNGLATVAGEKILRAMLILFSIPLAALWLSDSNLPEVAASALHWPGSFGWGLFFTGAVLAVSLITVMTKRWLRLPEKERLIKLWKDFLQGLNALWNKKTAAAMVWTAVSLAAFGLQVVMVGRALAIDLPALTLISCHMLALAVFTLIPVSAGGFGTEEVVILTLFTHLGVSIPVATAYAMLNIVLLSFFLPAIGAMAWLIRPIPFSKSGPAMVWKT